MSVYRSMIFKHFSRYTHCSLPMSSSFFGMHRLNHLFRTWILFSLCHQNFVCKCNFVWRTGKQKKEQRAEKYLFVIYLLFTSGRYKMTLFLTNAWGIFISEETKELLLSYKESSRAKTIQSYYQAMHLLIEKSVSCYRRSVWLTLNLQISLDKVQTEALFATSPMGFQCFIRHALWWYACMATCESLCWFQSNFVKNHLWWLLLILLCKNTHFRVLKPECLQQWFEFDSFNRD